MTFTPYTFAQGSGAWYLARVGRLTSSCAEAMLAKGKGKAEAKTRTTLRSRLVCERLTGRSEESAYTNAYMEHGQSYEAEALARYESETGELVRRVGFLASNELMAGCSPDGYIGNYDVIVEAKCPKASTHLEYRASGSIPTEYVKQIKHHFWISGARCCDFVSYCPWLPENLNLYIRRYERVEADMTEYDVVARAFLDEVDREYHALLSPEKDLNVLLRASLDKRKDSTDAV